MNIVPRLFGTLLMAVATCLSGCAAFRPPMDRHALHVPSDQDPQCKVFTVLSHVGGDRQEEEKATKKHLRIMMGERVLTKDGPTYPEKLDYRCKLMARTSLKFEYRFEDGTFVVDAREFPTKYVHHPERAYRPEKPIFFQDTIAPRKNPTCWRWRLIFKRDAEGNFVLVEKKGNFLP